MPLPADEQIQALAKEILAQSEYARWRQNDLTLSWVQWLMREIAELQQWLGALARDSPWLFAGLLTGLALLACGLLLHAGWTIWRSLQGSDAATATPSTPAEPPMARAATLATAGRFLDAARLVQLAVLEHLVSRRVLTLSPAESNAVLTRRLQSAALPSALRDRATELVTALERRWFRDRLEDEDLYRAWTRLHDDMTTTVA